MKITIDLTKDEYCELKAVATMCSISMRNILEQFVADLTHSRRTGGSDERLLARRYVMRCNYSHPLWGLETDDFEEQLLLVKREKQAEKWSAAAKLFRENSMT